jgi:FtsH-binding integral membrane protein
VRSNDDDDVDHHCSVRAAPTVAYYAGADPQAVWQAGGATALFIAGFGAAGYATRRDLSPLARSLLWALVALIVFGIVLVFVQIPGGALIYAVVGLLIFAGLTLFDLEAVRRAGGRTLRPSLALKGSAFQTLCAKRSRSTSSASGRTKRFAHVSAP